MACVASFTEWMRKRNPVLLRANPSAGLIAMRLGERDEHKKTPQTMSTPNARVQQQAAPVRPR